MLARHLHQRTQTFLRIKDQLAKISRANPQYQYKICKRMTCQGPRWKPAAAPQLWKQQSFQNLPNPREPSESVRKKKIQLQPFGGRKTVGFDLRKRTNTRTGMMPKKLAVVFGAVTTHVTYHITSTDQT